MPEFPHFKALELSDREVFTEYFVAYQPQTSEWTFTNLFIWRDYFNYQWSIVEGALSVVARQDNDVFGLQPIAQGSRRRAVDRILGYLSEAGSSVPTIRRADRRLTSELESNGFLIRPTEDHFDYVYRSSDLIELAGRKFHSKRNFIRGFLSSTPTARYRSLTPDLLASCQDLTDRWCSTLPCAEDMNLRGEWSAAQQALAHFDQLRLRGGVYLVHDRVEAYSIGEMLNPNTAVIHVEKANRDIRGLYAAINREFARDFCSGVSFVNREQDLGDEGLRKAKLSYQPHHQEEKFEITWR